MLHRMQDHFDQELRASEGATELLSMILMQSDFLHQISLERLIDRSDMSAAAQKTGLRK
jgi:hypothetical protein